MKTVGARLDARTDDSPLIVPELSRGVLGDQVELLDGINPRCITDFVVLVFAVEDSVNEIFVGLLAVSVDVRAIGVCHALGLAHAVGVDRRCARR